jgi:endonuclease YncB( thermonuclease family)
MISAKQVVAMGVAAFVVHSAFGEGSFFKDRRDAAGQVKPSAAPARVESAQSAPLQTAATDQPLAPVPVPVARDVEQSVGRATTEQAPPLNETEMPAQQRSSGASQPPGLSTQRDISGAAQAPAPEPTRAAAPADISGQVSEVPSTDTLVVVGQRVTLAGVRGVSEMAPPLQRWIAGTGNSVTCRPAGSHYRCNTADGSDVAQVVLQNGGGTATPDAPASYRSAEIQARMARRGIWRRR